MSNEYGGLFKGVCPAADLGLTAKISPFLLPMAYLSTRDRRKGILEIAAIQTAVLYILYITYI